MIPFFKTVSRAYITDSSRLTWGGALTVWHSETRVAEGATVTIWVGAGPSYTAMKKISDSAKPAGLILFFGLPGCVGLVQRFIALFVVFI